MFRIIVTVLLYVNGVPTTPDRLHSQAVFERLEDCQEARPAPGSVIIFKDTPARVETAVCARLPNNPDGVDLIADTLRLMIQGGGFGAHNN